MRILDIINKFSKLFLDSKKASSGSKNSIRTYTLILERFYDFIASELDKHENLLIFDINRYFLNNYIIYLGEQGLKKNTQYLNINVIKQFLNFIADSNLNVYGAIKLNITGVKVKLEQKEAEYCWYGCSSD